MLTFSDQYFSTTLPWCGIPPRKSSALHNAKQYHNGGRICTVPSFVPGEWFYVDHPSLAVRAGDWLATDSYSTLLTQKLGLYHILSVIGKTMIIDEEGISSTIPSEMHIHCTARRGRRVHEELKTLHSNPAGTGQHGEISTANSSSETSAAKRRTAFGTSLRTDHRTWRDRWQRNKPLKHKVGQWIHSYPHFSSYSRRPRHSKCS